MVKGDHCRIEKRSWKTVQIVRLGHMIEEEIVGAFGKNFGA